LLSLERLWAWFTDPSTWEGRYGLWNLLVEHLALSLGAILLAALVALPIGIVVGHVGKGQALVVGMSSISRAIPTMGLLFALVMLFGVTFRELAVTLALAAIAVPPILAGAYSGISAIERSTRVAATAQGMKPMQLIWHVELPLAAQSIIGGFRIAFIQVVSTVVLAPLVGLGGLGFGIIQGLALRDFPQVTGTALVIVLLTISGDRLIELAQRGSRVSIATLQKTGKR
jgi:ABC-type proline/glycine betaine transport systems, permease component